MTAPIMAIGVAVAVVWYFWPQPESGLAPNASELSPPATAIAAPRVAELNPVEAASAALAVAATPAPPRSPLPGETPTTPMTQMLADRQQNVIVRDDPDAGRFPPGLADGEREFAAEPIDETWAPGAEADLLAEFAQMPGLKLIDLQVQCRSTMCQLQLTQPPATPGQDGPTPFNILNDEIGLTPRWMMVVVDGVGAPTDAQPIKSLAYYWREGFARRDCFKSGQPTICSNEANRNGN